MPSASGGKAAGLHALENDLIREAITVQERGELKMVPDGESELEPKGKLKRRIDATAPVIISTTWALPAVRFRKPI